MVGFEQRYRIFVLGDLFLHQQYAEEQVDYPFTHCIQPYGYRGCGFIGSGVLDPSQRLRRSAVPYCLADIRPEPVLEMPHPIEVLTVLAYHIPERVGKIRHFVLSCALSVDTDAREPPLVDVRQLQSLGVFYQLVSSDQGIIRSGFVKALVKRQLCRHP